MAKVFDFDEACENRLWNKIYEGSSRDYMLTVCTLFELSSEEVGGIFSPPKSAHTINGYKRKFDGAGATEISKDDKEFISEFIATWYRGPQPLRSLKAKIRRNLRYINL